MVLGREHDIFLKLTKRYASLAIGNVRNFQLSARGFDGSRFCVGWLLIC